MKLLREIIEEVTPEITLNEATQEKDYRIKGIFMEADTCNRNNRMYPKKVMESALTSYKKLIEERRAMGELNHPANPQVNLDKVAILITGLDFGPDGKKVLGEAKVLNTPMGQIVKEFLKESVKIGLSSRALGSTVVKEGVNIVQPDFRINAIDIVSDPSGPECFVSGLMESADWIFDEESGVYVIAERLQQKVAKMSAREIEAKSLQIFEQFIKSL